MGTYLLHLYSCTVAMALLLPLNTSISGIAEVPAI